MHFEQRFGRGRSGLLLVFACLPWLKNIILFPHIPQIGCDGFACLYRVLLFACFKIRTLFNERGLVCIYFL